MSKASEELAVMKEQVANANESTIEKLMDILPKEQQETVKACIVAAQAKGPNGVRFTNSFILECLLLRIKSRRAYIHIREHKLLTVPSMTTLTRQLKALKPSFGFCNETFAALQSKAIVMAPEDRRGN